KKRMARNYFVPRFAELDCLTGRSEYTNWNYDLRYAELEVGKIRDKAVFTIKGPRKRNIVIRLDVAESLLRRGAKGFLLRETDVKGD
ncbi:MAG: hypothetical protein K2H91_01740, partial [Lachnospiraceae bacterium]|nr:hypothetical protein [Lachnospiraceae bacterium]